MKYPALPKVRLPLHQAYLHSQKRGGEEVPLERLRSLGEEHNATEEKTNNSQWILVKPHRHPLKQRRTEDRDPLQSTMPLG
jgi:hypothetical protein